MRFLEEAVGNLRGEMYRDIREIVKKRGEAGLLECDIYEFVWANGGRNFHCTTIKMDVDGGLYFYDGDFCLHGGYFNTDDLMYMHDELIDYFGMYDKC